MPAESADLLIIGSGQGAVPLASDYAAAGKREVPGPVTAGGTTGYPGAPYSPNPSRAAPDRAPTRPGTGRSTYIHLTYAENLPTLARKARASS